MGPGSNLTQPTLAERITRGYVAELAGDELTDDGDNLSALLTLTRIPSEHKPKI